MSARNLINTIKEVYQKEGFRSLYKGLNATYVKLLPSTAIAFSINERMKDYFL